MKYVILLGDGMADVPLPVLENKTPLEYAFTPNMDRMASEGTLGMIDTIPRGFLPGSDVANLAVLGYDPLICYTGRGPLEAANMGLNLLPSDVAFRCNLVSLSDGPNPFIEDFTAGHISSDEAAIIIKDLGKMLGSDIFFFYPGVGYRHLIVWRDGEPGMMTTPPHDIVGKEIAAFLPRGEGADKIIRLILLSRDILADHDVNRKRRAKGLKTANAIWPWGQGRAPKIQKLTERFKINGGVISAVDLINGIGIFAGLEVLKVEGATGYTDTNYIGKAEKALAALRELDLVFLHVEAPDEMGHEGNLDGKIKSIEDFDEKVVGTILRGIVQYGEYRVAVLSDHPTPIPLRTHSGDPSPIAVLSSNDYENQALDMVFGESEAKKTGNMISPGHEFMQNFITGRRSLFG